MEAIKIFKKYKHESLEARCLRNLATLKYRINEDLDAKRHIEDALQISKKINDTH